MVFVESLLGMSRDCFGVWAYVIVFFAIFLESIPFIGAFIPGGIIALFLCGLLVKFGYFVMWKIVLVCLVASVGMDVVGYSWGRSRKQGFVCRRARMFLIKKRVMEKVGCLVKKHAAKSIFLGKINPVTRSIAPFIVGNERVPFRKFIAYSVGSSLLWVTFFILVGYVFGNSIELVRSFEHFLIWAIVIGLGGFYVCCIGKLFKRFFGGKSNGCYCCKSRKN